MNNYLNLTDIAAISPLIIILVTSLVVILIECFDEKSAKKTSFIITLLGLSTALISTFFVPFSTNPLLSSWLRFDNLSHFFTVFFLLIGLACTLLAVPFFKQFKVVGVEYYFFLLSAIFGLILIGDSADFLTLFLGIETLSISLYVLCGYMKKWRFSPESSFKYFLMGSLAAAFLLYGIALIYGAVGTTRFEDLFLGYSSLQNAADKNLFLAGAAFVTLGLAFEATIVPFHIWAPDVYEGASNPVTAFMSVGTKVGAFAAFIRVFLEALPHFNPVWNDSIALLAYLTLIFANLVALQQVQMRRFFAYSGISHAGFLLIPLAAGTPEALPSMLFYLVVYAFATLGAFAVLAFIDQWEEGVTLNDLQGFFKKSPLLASVFALCLLTLGGIPPTIGFFAKFYIFQVAFHAGYYGLVIVGLITTILAAYYYLRIVAIMMRDTQEDKTKVFKSWSAGTLALIVSVAIIMLTIYPAPFINLLSYIM